MGSCIKGKWGVVMKRLLPWVFPLLVLILLVLQITHTGPTDLWAGLVTGVVMLYPVIVGIVIWVRRRQRLS